MLISPFTATIDEDTKERIRRFVEEGGTWIVGPMSDMMTDYTARPTYAPYYFLEEMAGVYTKYQKPVGNDVFKAKWNDGGELGISLCYDAYEPRNCKSLAEYDGDEFGGLSVVTERQVGKGKVILVGSMLSADGWQKLVGIKPICEASDNVRVVERGGDRQGIIIMDVDNASGYAVLDGRYRVLPSGDQVTGRIEIKPYEVIVLERI